MKVSVIIPCYNVENYLSNALMSVLAQDHDDIQIICVNDGSVDGTVSLLHKHKLDFAPEMVIIEQAHKGAASARNAGLDAAEGEYVQFLDADDVLLPGKISSQLKLLLNNAFSGFVAGGYERRHPDGTRDIIKRYPEDSLGNPWLDLIESNLGNTCANLFRKDALEKVNGWEDGLESSQEYNLMFRLLKEGVHVAYDKEVNTIINIRADGSSITQNNLQANAERFLRLRADVFEYLMCNKILVNEDKTYQSLYRALLKKTKDVPVLVRKYYEKLLPDDFTPELT